MGRAGGGVKGLAARAIAVLLVAVAPLTVRAQAGDLVVAPRPTPLQCLQPSKADLPPIVYPARLLERKQGATIRVRLNFSSPTEPPQVEVYFNDGGPAFADAVLARVAAYRLPCLADFGGAWTVSQEFQFLPGDGNKVIWSATRSDRDDDDRYANCLRGGPGERTLTYPKQAMDRGETGTVLVGLTFTAPDRAPDVEVLNPSGGTRRLAETVSRYVGDYRVPCLQSADVPLKTTQVFRFVIEGDRDYRLKDMPLRGFLGAVAGLDRQSVRFDFNTMGCPFDLKLRVYQPYLPNHVGEVGRSDPNRREFIEWLKSVKLDLPAEAGRAVIGDTTTLAVPCGILDLL